MFTITSNDDIKNSFGSLICFLIFEAKSFDPRHKFLEC